MMDVGPSDEAIAKTPKEAAVPPFEGAKFTRTIARKVPSPQRETTSVRWLFLVTGIGMVVGGGGRILIDARLPRTSMKTPRQGTRKKPITLSR
jgi:hypothetical protein